VECPARSVYAVLLCLAVTPTAFGQSASAMLSGVVVDETGAVVPEVTVRVLNRATGWQRMETTSREGTFTVPLLPPGQYIVRAQRDGFTPLEVPDVVLNVNDQIALRLQLKVAQVGESVTVTAEPPRLNTSPGVSTVIDRQFVENMPLNGRTLQSLISLTPGAVLTKSNVNEQGQFSVNGQRSDANYYTIDGVSANIGVSANASPTQAESGSLPGLSALASTNNLVSIDALQEFKVQTSSYAPEFGRQPGGQVQIVTRSGTNQFHGSVFNYLRNDAFDANDWFNDSLRIPKPALRQNDFGGTLGGPVLLPRFGDSGRQPWYNGRDRTFFFFSYEGLRILQPTTTLSQVPSASLRQTAPAQLQPLLNAFPIPNGTDFGNGFAGFNASYSNPSTLDATSIRVDHRVNSILTLFGRYNHSPSESRTRATIELSNVRQMRNITDTATVGATWVPAPSLVNEFRANWSRSETDLEIMLDSFGGAVRPADSVVFPSFASSADSQFIFQLRSGVNPVYSFGPNNDNFQRQLNIVDALSLVKGSHQLKAGVDYRRLTPITNPVSYFLEPIFSVSNTGALSTNATQVVTGATAKLYPLITNVSAYGQDAWRLSRRATLTYGLRWDVNPPPSERNGNVPATVNQVSDPMTMTLAQTGTPLYRKRYGNVAPRIGLAYAVSQRKGLETSFHGGVGIFYDLGMGSLTQGFTAWPYTAVGLFSNVPYPLSAAVTARPSLPAALPTQSQFYVADPDLKVPRTYQWNIAFEQSLGADQALTATYVGAVGRDLLREAVFINPTPSFSRVFVTTNASTSSYQGLQLQFRRRLSKGLQALASYTWSDAIDDVSSDLTQTPPIGNIPPSLDRGPSDSDVRHSVTAALTYNIPVAASTSVGALLLRGWSADGILRGRSAFPVNITVTRNIGFGTYSFRPDVVPGVPVYLDNPTVGGGRQLNPAAFTVSPAARQGTLGRNAIRGFAASQLDIALRRDFRLTEKLHLRFSSEIFNIFNQPNFADPVSLLGSANPAGVLTPNPLFGKSAQILGRSLGGVNPLYQVGGPRSIQFALKIIF
jgi:hypothetical protein